MSHRPAEIETGAVPPADGPGHARIVDRGRGPEVEGTRVTVYRVMDYARDQLPISVIAAELGITVEQAKVALEYIESHRDEVEATYAIIMGRVDRTNPPWVEGLIAGTPDELRQRLRARRAAKGADDRRGGQ